MAMKSKFLISLTTILVATALMAGATLALFTSETTVQGNTLGVGSLELTIDNPEAKNFAIDNIYPGKEFAMMDVDIHNSGSLPYYLKAVITETDSEKGPGGGNLAEVVNIAAVLMSGDSETEYNLSLESVLENDLIWKKGSEYLIIEPGQTASFQLNGQFDLAAGNEYQESTWEGLVTFSAVQSDGQVPGAGFSWGEIEPGSGASQEQGLSLSLTNSALDPAAFSASRTDAGNVASLAEVDPEDVNAFWQINDGGSGLEDWVQYDFSAAEKVYKYALRSSGTGGARAPSAWTLQGSNDTQGWIDLDQRTGVSFSNSEEKTYTIEEEKVGSYRYYRILISESAQKDRTVLGLVKLFTEN
jgi:hypothetical protein